MQDADRGRRCCVTGAQIVAAVLYRARLRAQGLLWVFTGIHVVSA